MREILFVSQKYCEFLWLFDETKRYAADLVLATPRLSDACYSDKQASIWSSYLRTAILGRTQREDDDRSGSGQLRKMVQ